MGVLVGKLQALPELPEHVAYKHRTDPQATAARELLDADVENLNSYRGVLGQLEAGLLSNEEFSVQLIKYATAADFLMGSKCLAIFELMQMEPEGSPKYEALKKEQRMYSSWRRAVEAALRAGSRRAGEGYSHNWAPLLERPPPEAVAPTYHYLW
jgi:hypothetical protein